LHRSDRDCSLNSLQREQLPNFKAGISVEKRIKLTLVTRTGEWPSCSKS
jgi:hypothetical protein